jgi:hypothetical protein
MERAARRARLKLVPDKPAAAVACDVRARLPAGAKPSCSPDEPPKHYPGQGNYCGRHARMMIPESRWDETGVPARPKTTAKAKAGAQTDTLEAETG